MTVTRKRIVNRFSYAKPLLEFKVKLGEKEQNVYKNFEKTKNWRRLRLTCAQIQVGSPNDQNAS